MVRADKLVVWAVALGLAMGALALESGAHAQPAQAPRAAAAAPPSLADSLPGEARANYDAGRVLFEDQDYAGALVKFERAFKHTPDPRLLWNMAACEKSLRHYARALELLERYSREGALKMSESQRDQLIALMDTLRSLISNVHLVVDEPGASVFVDDRLAGTTPLPGGLFVDLGARRIRVSKPGFQDQIINQEFSGGSELTLYLTLAPEPREAKITIASDAASSISIDGQVMGQARWEGLLRAGDHTLRVTAPGMVAYEKDIVVQAGQPRTLFIRLDKDESSGVPAWLWVGVGVVAAGGIATGAYFLMRPDDSGDHTLGTLTPSTVQLPLRISR